jgi:hypothetical protein
MRVSPVGLVPVAALVMALLATGCGKDQGPPRPPLPSGAWHPDASSPPPWPPFIVLGRRTDPEAITWSYDGSGAAVDPDAAREAIVAAFRQWEAAAPVTFIPAPSASDGRPADLLFAWHGKEHATCTPFIEWDGGVAHAGASGAQAFIHFNQDVPFTTDKGPGRSFFCTALHEIGHILGLGHAPDPVTVMHGGYDDAHDQLTPGDVFGIQSLYGGGVDGPGDLHLVTFAPDGTPVSRGHPLRRIAPARCTLAVLDTDGDSLPEILLWTTDAPDGAFLIVHLLDGHLLLRTRLLLGVTRVDRTTSATTSAKDHTPLLIHVRPDARYTAQRFEAGLPTEPLPPGPLHLDNGLTDTDGDGRLDIATPTAPTPANTADIDGDGHPDTLTREGPSTFRWLLTATSPDARHPAAPFTATEVHITDLDGDGLPDAVLRR